MPTRQHRQITACLVTLIVTLAFYFLITQFYILPKWKQLTREAIATGWEAVATTDTCIDLLTSCRAEKHCVFPSEDLIHPPL